MGLLGVADMREIHTSHVLFSTQLHWVLTRKTSPLSQSFSVILTLPLSIIVIFSLLSLVGLGQKRVLCPSHSGRILLKIWARLFSDPPNRVFSLSKTEAIPGKHRILTGIHHKVSKHEYQATDYCLGEATVNQENLRCRCPGQFQSCKWNGNIIF